MLLGVAAVAAVVRAGDDGSDVANTGTDTTAAPTDTSSTTSTTSTSTTTTTAATATTTTSGAPATTAAPAGGTGDPGSTTTSPPTVLGTGRTGGGSSGLADDDAGQVAMGPEIPETGIESALGPGAALAGAALALRVLVVGGRRRDGGGTS